MSVRKLSQNNYKVTFDMKSVEVVNKNHKLYCKRENNLYMYILKLSPKKDKVCVGFEASRTQKAEIWHRNLDHLNRKGMRILGLPMSNDKCSACVESKAGRPIFYERKKQSQEIGSDLSGPMYSRWTLILSNGDR